MIVIDHPRHAWQNNPVIRRVQGQALLWVICLGLSILTARAEAHTNKARDEAWWSLRSVERPPLPEGPESNPVDRFLNAEHRKRALKAVGPADKLSLLRRVYLDLIGLPPSPAQQQDFLADESADAYEKVVDRLLGDEQHAVRYARHWLDVLRY